MSCFTCPCFLYRINQVLMEINATCIRPQSVAVKVCRQITATVCGETRVDANTKWLVWLNIALNSVGHSRLHKENACFYVLLHINMVTDTTDVTTGFWRRLCSLCTFQLLWPSWSFLQLLQSLYLSWTAASPNNLMIRSDTRCLRSPVCPSVRHTGRIKMWVLHRHE